MFKDSSLVEDAVGTWSTSQLQRNMILVSAVGILPTSQHLHAAPITIIVLLDITVGTLSTSQSREVEIKSQHCVLQLGNIVVGT